MILTYKYQLKGKRSVRLLRRYAWAVNQVWNYCVATQKDTQRRWRNGGDPKWKSPFDLTKLTSGTSRDLGIHAQTVQCVSDQFVKSRDQRGKCPRFRKSSEPKRSLGWVPFQQQSRQLEGNAVIYLGRTFRFFGAKRRPLPPIVKGGAFVEDSRGRWWVCFHVDIADTVSVNTAKVGIDLGLKHLAVTSDGDKVENIRTYRLWEQKLGTAQRAGNRKRAKAIHEKIRNIRKDHHHKVTTKIVKRYGLIVVGNVSSSKLAKTRLGKAVLDAGWSTFRNQLRYKASRHGVAFLEVDEKGSTQTCSACGNKSSTSRPRGIAGLGIREWKCDSCGAVHDRDMNAAKNILTIGLSAQPRVDESRDSVERRVA